MKARTPLVILLFSLTPVCTLADIYRCRGSEGEVLFSQIPCGNGAAKVVTGEGSWVDGATMKRRSLQQLESLRQIPSPTLPRTVVADDPQLGYADRALLRRLEMEVEGMRRDMRRAGPKRQKVLARKLSAHGRELKALRKHAN